MHTFQTINNALLNKVSSADSAAHDWYRFVLSYPPHLVREYAQRFEVTSSDLVLDPFCGTGTTIVECKKLAIPSVGIEAHPMSCFASRTKSCWGVDSRQLEDHAEIVARKTVSRLEDEGISDGELLLFEESNASTTGRLVQYRTLPAESHAILLKDSISERPLHKVLVLLDVINEMRDPACHNYELLALAKALVSSIGNLHFGPEVGIGKIKVDAPVVGSWLRFVRSIARDLENLRQFDQTTAVVHQADSRQIHHLLPPESVRAVITSPPYPNEKDYTRTTRLESVILGLIRNKQELRALKQHLLRSNTRNVYKEDDDDRWVTSYGDINAIAKAIEARRIELGKTSGFERLYHRVARLYFGGMAKHLADLRAVLKPGARLAYVVGDQASYLRVMIRTGQLLANIATTLGYEVVDIDLFRTRLATATKEQLREEVLVLHWPGRSGRISEPATTYKRKDNIMPKEPTPNRYALIIEEIFFKHYRKGSIEVVFKRNEMEAVAKRLGIKLPKNLGDVVYSFRYRASLPDRIRAKAPTGKQWIIRPAGRSKYSFALVSDKDISPTEILADTKIPESTPGLISLYALNDEQALLAKLRYNRLIDIFTGITCYSLQNHLRTSVAKMGQVETDEVYVGVDRKGVHYVLPVQAKGGKDKISIVQIEQDFAMCSSKFNGLICRAIGAQFMPGNKIALFEFENTPEGVKIVAEKHYQLVLPEEVTPEILKSYRERLPDTM